MGMIDNILSRLGYTKAGTKPAAIPLAMAGDYSWERDPSILLRNYDLYSKVGWIYSATNSAAEYAAGVKLCVTVEEEGEDNEKMQNHPFTKLLRRPNPLQSRAEFLTASFSYYLLAHNCYWWINAPTGTEPLELWIIPPGQITPVTDERLFISHYEYIPDSGSTLKIPVEQVVHFKKFNPKNPFAGGGLFETVHYQALTDYGAVRNQALMQTENNGTPPGLLAFAERHEDTQWALIKAELSAAAAKMQKYLPIRGVGPGGVQWLPNALSDRDMQVIEKRGFTRDEIFQIIAPGLLNMLLPNATEANAKTGKATFTEFVIFPLLNAFAEKITSDLLPRYGVDLVAEFDEVRVKDKVLELSEMAEYSRTHTVAEVRQKYWNDKPLNDERDNLFPAQINAATGDGEEEPEPAPVVPSVVPPPPGAPQLPPPNPAPAVEPPAENMAESENPDAAEAADLAKYQRKALNWIERGKDLANLPRFESAAIRPAELDRLYTALPACKSAAEVRAVFAEPRPAGDELAAQIARALDYLEAHNDYSPANSPAV